MRKIGALVGGLAVLAAGLFGGEADSPGYELHEWGVFSACADHARFQERLQREWEGFPDFFYCRGADGHVRNVRSPHLNVHRGMAVPEKPVIWLRASTPQKVRLSVRFPGGNPSVWWPFAELQVRTLVFDARIGTAAEEEAGRRIRPRMPVPPFVPPGHWVEALRKVPANLLDVRGASEHFLYYDGEIPAPPAPAAARDKGAIILSTALPFDALDVRLIERQDGKVRISKGWLDRIGAGERRTSFEMEDVTKDPKWTDAAASGLLDRLKGTGLTPEEAEAMVEVWRSGFFESEGLTLLYRVPQETYDAWLPLSAEPKPAKTVRVGMVWHTHLEPELAERLEKLVAGLGSPDFAKREAATAALRAMGAAARPVLERHRGDADFEVSSACRELLEALDPPPPVSTPIDRFR